MSLSRRGCLLALGRAVPAATLLPVDAEAATQTRRRAAAGSPAAGTPAAGAHAPAKPAAHGATRRTAQAHPPAKPAKPTATRSRRATAAHRRRRPTAA